MTLLPDHMIAAFCRPHGGVYPSLIEPFDENRLQPASHDLTLGNEFILFDDLRISAIDLSNPPKDAGRKMKISDKDGILLKPMEFVLGVTREVISLPPNVAGRLDGKSSLARWGLLIHVTGGNVDPGWRGPLTLEIFNAFPIPILLRPGKPVCQIVFQRLLAPAARPYSGRYQDAKGVESSKYDGN